jgi:hypothetical protein
MGGLGYSPRAEDWIKIQKNAKCVVYVCNGDDSGPTLYWSKYVEVPNRNLIETVLHFEDAKLIPVTEGSFEGYIRMTLNIKVLSDEDLKEEIEYAETAESF